MLRRYYDKEVGELNYTYYVVVLYTHATRASSEGNPRCLVSVSSPVT